MSLLFHCVHAHFSFSSSHFLFSMQLEGFIECNHLRVLLFLGSIWISCCWFFLWWIQHKKNGFIFGCDEIFSSLSCSTNIDSIAFECHTKCKNVAQFMFSSSLRLTNVNRWMRTDECELDKTKIYTYIHAINFWGENELFFWLNAECNHKKPI